MNNEDDIVLSTGRAFYANRGIVGIDAKGNVSEGYDGGVDVWGHDGWSKRADWSREDRDALADMMIARWTAFRAMTERPTDDS